MYDTRECVYILRAVDTSNFKIGFSTNVEKRIVGWRNVMPFIELEPVAVYFTPQAKRLEAALHKHFTQYRLGNTEWFELPIDEEPIFEQMTEQLLSMFSIYETSINERGAYDYKSFFITSAEENEPIYAPEQNPQVNEELDKPHRLKRLPDYQTLDDPPSIREEFEFGLLPEMLDLYEELQSWGAVGQHYGVSGKAARNVAEHKIMPMDNNNRRKFGLCMIYPDFEDGQFQ